MHYLRFSPGDSPHQFVITCSTVRLHRVVHPGDVHSADLAKSAAQAYKNQSIVTQISLYCAYKLHNSHTKLYKLTLIVRTSNQGGFNEAGSESDTAQPATGNRFVYPSGRVVSRLRSSRPDAPPETSPPPPRANNLPAIRPTPPCLGQGARARVENARQVILPPPRGPARAGTPPGPHCSAALFQFPVRCCCVWSHWCSLYRLSFPQRPRLRRWSVISGRPLSAAGP